MKIKNNLLEKIKTLWVDYGFKINKEKIIFVGLIIDIGDDIESRLTIILLLS